MSSSPTPSAISIVTTSTDDAAVHQQAVARCNRDLTEALARFPTLRPGRVSPDSTQTRYHSLDWTTGIRDGSRGPESVEGDGATVEGGADSEGPGEATSPTRIEIVECRCGSLINAGAFCDRCQGRGRDERDEYTCGQGDDQCICMGRCPADWPDDCTFRTTQKVCQTHGTCCMGCDRLLRECTCEHDEVYIPNPDILRRIPLAVGAIRRHDAARAARRATRQRRQEVEEDTVVDDSEESEDKELGEWRVLNYRCVGDDELAEEFWENTLPQYMPFKMRHKGRVQEARYVTIHYESNPIAFGTMGGGHQILQQPAYTAAHVRESEAPRYTHNDTCILHHDYPGQTWVDDALIHINNDSLRAEVHRHRSLLQEAKEKEVQIQVLEDRVTDITMEVHANMKQLVRAQAVSCVKEHCGTTARAVHAWTFERGRST